MNSNVSAPLPLFRVRYYNTLPQHANLLEIRRKRTKAIYRTHHKKHSGNMAYVWRANFGGGGTILRFVVASNGDTMDKKKVDTVQCPLLIFSNRID